MTDRPFNLGDFADLPQEFESLLLEVLHETARADARDALRRALSDLRELDPDLRIQGFRMDAIVGRSRDWWVLPAPTAEAIVNALAASVSLLGGLLGKTMTEQVIGAVVFQGWIMAKGATKVSLEQAIVLRVLRQAHKGAGWTLARVVDELPNGILLTLAEVTDIVADLRSLRTVHGEKPAWSIEENPQAPGHYWTLRV